MQYKFLPVRSRAREELYRSLPTAESAIYTYIKKNIGEATGYRLNTI